MSSDETREPFQPDTIDESIVQMTGDNILETRLTQNLRHIYRDEREEEEALERVHQRFLTYMSTNPGKMGSQASDTRAARREKVHPVHIKKHTPHASDHKKRAAFVMASVVAVLIAASFLFALQANRIYQNPQATQIANGGRTPQATQLGNGGNVEPLYILLEEQIIKYDPIKQQVLWRQTFVQAQEQFSYVNPQPILSDGRLYFMAGNSGQAYTFVVNSETGAMQRYAMDLAYVSAGIIYANEGDKIQAFDTDGKLKQEYPRTGTIATIANGIMYTTKLDQYGSVITALRLSDGEVLWEKQVDTDRGIGDIVVRGSTIYVPTKVGEGSIGKIKTTYLYALDAVNGQVQWRSPEISSTSIAKPAIDDQGRVYFGTNEFVYALDGKTHNVAWHQKVDHPTYTQPRVVGDMVYFEQESITKQGKELYLYARDTKDGSQRWKSSVLRNSLSTQYPYSVLKDGIFFVGLYDGIVGVDAQSGAQVWNVSYETLLGKKVATPASSLLVKIS